MAINFQQVYQQVKQLVSYQRSQQAEIQKRQILAKHWMAEFEPRGDDFAKKLEKARLADAGVRCAAPGGEPVTASFAAKDAPIHATLIAVDGSQILPDRHQAAHFGLINTGAIIFRLGSGSPPDIFTESTLLSPDKLATPSGSPISDAMLGLMRDTEERVLLLTLANSESGADGGIFTFSDGPIELWGKREGEEGQLFEANLRRYLSVLSQLRDLKAVVSGYIDRPGSNLVLRMLEVAMADEQQIAEIKNHHPLDGISDHWIMGEMIKPSQRSAVFTLKSKAELDYTGDLAIHFFYLNVGEYENAPQIARVEIPAWVAKDSQAVEVLHSVLVNQCRMLGAKPFPYVLHRAHETAVVNFEEKKHIEEIFQMEMINQDHGQTIAVRSNKQTAKDGSRRARYGA